MALLPQRLPSFLSFSQSRTGYFVKAQRSSDRPYIKISMWFQLQPSTVMHFTRILSKMQTFLQAIVGDALRGSFFYLIFNPQFKMYMFHIFTFIYSSFTGILRTHNKLPVGLIAQLVEHCTGIAEVMGSNPVQA